MIDNISWKETQYFRNHISAWGKVNPRHFPWRSTLNPWHCLAVEIMLQRTKAEQVEPVYWKFIRTYSGPKEYLLDADINIFRGLGLPSRDSQFRLLNQIIIERGIPLNKPELMKLPGVGDYIASAFLSLHMRTRTALIDSNIVRLYGRFFGFNTDPETRRKAWLQHFAEQLTPKRVFRHYNYSVIDFSREICRPRPDCKACPVHRRCSFHTFLCH